jgi:prevent-host-death family protein
MTMIKINIHEAKTHLSKYLAKLKTGEHILICNHNRPVAEVTAVPTVSSTPRPMGLAKGTFTVPAIFFDPLPEDLLRGFEGVRA